MNIFPVHEPESQLTSVCESLDFSIGHLAGEMRFLQRNNLIGTEVALCTGNSVAPKPLRYLGFREYSSPFDKPFTYYTKCWKSIEKML